MNKYLLLFLLFTGFSVEINSQNIPFKSLKSKEFEDEYKKSSIVLSENDGNGNLLLVRSYYANGISLNRGFYIEHYDSNLKLVKDFEFEIKHPNTQKFNTIIGVNYIENHINIIEIFYDLNEKHYICQANRISNDFKVSKKELFRLRNDDVMKYGNLAIQHNCIVQSNHLFNFDNSGDINSETDNINDNFFNFSQKYSMVKGGFVNNFTMVTNETKTDFSIAIDFYGKKEEFLKLYLFDNKLNKKFESEFKREIKDNKYFFQNIQVSPEGDAIYLLGKSYSKELKKKEKGGKYQFELTKITANNQKSEIINPQEHYINTLRTVFHKNQLICLGFYSDINEDKFQGIIYFSFNSSTLSISKTKYNVFSDQFIIDKYGKKNDKGLKYLTFKNVFFTENDDLILNAEEQYFRSSSSFAGPMGGFSSGQTFYNYDDIVCAKLNAEGDLLWARNINKNQATSEEEFFISYTSYFKNDSCYFFINTDEKINEIKNNRIEFGQVRKNKSNLNVIRVNANGDFDYEEILDDENTAVPFMVSKGTLINNSIIFLGRKGKLKQLLKITL